ncbi:hypothetical protein ASE00_07570 [Sphingomonas sp. Root710]|uniref:hypothetical protein n=1 Tax=Sphingomonas sp. Root710 TaxID=1736594 RepID=UPI0006F32056|nr:hypothetical protein [Sphingomonas sp. Root710]KRB86544.1 hypothetical protein ASE00_07570 [Sphingomonas sp. Root710]
MLFGFSLGSLDTDKERYEPYRYAADKPAEAESAQAGVPRAQPLGYRRPCQDPKGETESDLCAQWKAANAAEDSAFWAQWGFWIAVVGSSFLLWQIMLTREAVEDTGRATEAMRQANRISENAQRAWITLGIEPDHASPYPGGGIYFRINFTAANVGNTEATHFFVKHSVLFQGAGESSNDFATRMLGQVEAWLDKIYEIKTLTVVPAERVVVPWWNDIASKDIPWAKILGPVMGSTPVFLMAAYYRTVSDPDRIQIVWRAWMLHAIDENGDAVHWIEQGKLYRRKDLYGDPFNVCAHHMTCDASLISAD